MVRQLRGRRRGRDRLGRVQQRLAGDPDILGGPVKLLHGQVRRQDLKDRPPGAERLVTPYDTDARGSVKRGIFWDGCKVHLTETCEWIRSIKFPSLTWSFAPARKGIRTSRPG
ncbi:hypothetical protein GCM10010383_78700 [Streptomyces lomondensis]|uniref:Uncharacterized protein n=1 Tax=Streptomyces lomondensis TaxID=68229 RepID=A0ABQ2XWZ6_9ACTN|nr:hypothetical protein GCM10010383_78700 [Streptomyces lomondensis]